MNEKFLKWHRLKNQINCLDPSKIFFRERDIWWSYLGKNIGSEQNGIGDYFLRPVLILKKFSKTTFLAIPLSTKIKSGNYYFPLLSELDIIRIALLNQITLLDIRRLTDKIDSISIQEMSFVKEKVIELIR